MIEIMIQTHNIIQSYKIEIYSLLTLCTALIALFMILGGMDE